MEVCFPRGAGRAPFESIAIGPGREKTGELNRLGLSMGTRRVRLCQKGRDAHNAN